MKKLLGILVLGLLICNISSAGDKFKSKDINEVLKLEKRHFGALSGQGLVQTELKNYEKAINSYKEVQKIYPSMQAPKIMIPRLKELIKGEST